MTAFIELINSSTVEIREIMAISKTMARKYTKYKWIHCSVANETLLEECLYVVPRQIQFQLHNFNCNIFVYNNGYAHKHTASISCMEFIIYYMDQTKEKRRYRASPYLYEIQKCMEWKEGEGVEYQTRKSKNFQIQYIYMFENPPHTKLIIVENLLSNYIHGQMVMPYNWLSDHFGIVLLGITSYFEIAKAIRFAQAFSPPRPIHTATENMAKYVWSECRH